MEPNAAINQPLISIIIPCYNQGIYLEACVRSVIDQDYPNKEIIIINDGSTDNTETISRIFTQVIYVHQNNQGLSAARNTGIRHANGEYLIFLDADDVLLPGAITYQVNFIESHPDTGFVSGGHIKANEQLVTLELVQTEISNHHYLHLLEGNYIGMHGAVIYRKYLFDKFSFDTQLKAAEDYDLYLKIAAEHPVLHHTKAIAVYRLQGNSMSVNLPLMLTSVLQVLRRQKKALRNSQQKNAYKKGNEVWKEYYCTKMYRLLLNSSANELFYRKQFLQALWKFRPSLYIRFFLN